MDEKRNPDLPEELSPPDGETIYFTAPEEAQYFDSLLDASSADGAPEAPVTDEFPALFPDEAAARAALGAYLPTLKRWRSQG